jgi:hypothetical protein
MLWPRLSPERSCVCCRSRRRLGRLRARPASHCNLDRVVFRYQSERRSHLLAASSYCATGIDPFGILPLRSSPSARTDQDGPQWVKCGRQIRPWTDFAPSPANPVGPLPLPIERPRPWSARSAIRRHETSPHVSNAQIPAIRFRRRERGRLTTSTSAAELSVTANAPARTLTRRPRYDGGGTDVIRLSALIAFMRNFSS